MHAESANAMPTPPTVPTTKHGTLMLAGFWGRGNAGDEAMLQCIIETMGDSFDYAISVEEHGAYPKFWDWYPYVARRIVNATDIHSLRQIENPLGLLVGGGGLPLGFSAHKQVFARARGLRTAIAGIDAWEMAANPAQPAAAEANRYLSGFGLAYVRTEASIQIARRGGFEKDLKLGGDWALALTADQAPHVFDQQRRALVVLREDTDANLALDYKEQIQRLLRALSVAGYVPIFVPYAPEDEHFLERMQFNNLAPIERSWWNPRRLKQLSANSGLTISVGRLHPMIFAAPTGRPIMTIGRPTVRTGRSPDSKLRHMAADLGIDLYGSVDDAILALEAGNIRPAELAKVDAAKARLERQTEQLRHFFARQGEE